MTKKGHPAQGDPVGNFAGSLPPLRLLEQALAGAAVHHVDNALELERHIDPQDFTGPKYRAVLAAAYQAAGAGLLETATPNAQVIHDMLQTDGADVSLYDLSQMEAAAPCRGTHFRRTLDAWKRARDAYVLAQELEQLKRGVLSGRLDRDALSVAMGYRHE